MSTQLTVQFFVVALLFAMTPGADWAFAIASGLKGGRFYPAIAGMLSGYMLVVTLIALGIGVLVTQHPIALDVLTVFGAAYLLWLGGKTLHSVVRATNALDATAPPSKSTGAFLQGFAISSLNPKGLLLLVALLPQFVSPGQWAMPVQLLILGTLFVMSCAIVYPTVSLTARKLLAKRPQAARIVTGFSGTVMILLSAGLVVKFFLE